MERIERWKKRIELRLRELFKVKEPKLLAEAMSYYLFQKGKRIRPLVTVAVSSALKGNEEDAITVGCVIEMIHNYSLIHDDLPAMDNDDLRRGLPTCHRKFGEAVAILAGDALLTYAFEVLSDRRNFRSLSPETILEIVKVITQKSGAEGMVGGQVLDITKGASLEKINLMKTAALFEACFISGGLIADRRDLLKDLERLGREVGFLFQITDDLIDKDGFCKSLGEEGAKERARQVYMSALDLSEELFRERREPVLYLIEKIYKRIT